jgi:polysaccharide export outer membrane protein
MGRTVPLLLLRASAILCAGLLLFAVFGPARAASYDGDNYGLAPLPPASQAAAATATGSGFGSAPLGGGFAPVPGGSQPAPSYQPAPAYGGNPAGGGFMPAPVSSGYQVAQSAPPSYQPAPAYQQPAYQQPAYQQPQADYGFRPERPATRAPTPVQPMPAAARPAADSSTPYGYKKGDGTSDPAMAAAYYQPRFQAADNSPRVNPDYVLGTGDKIHLTVFDEADLSGDYTVDGSGFVRLPLIGQVRAGGLTPPQLEAAVGSALAAGYLRSPRVSVEVATYRPFYVIGAVGRPGEYPYVNHMNVLNAIAMAGGYLPSAIESTVYVRRQGGLHEQKMAADASTLIHPGDVVRVETTFFWDAMSLFSPLNGVASIAVAGIR